MTTIQRSTAVARPRALSSAPAVRPAAAVTPAKRLASPQSADTTGHKVATWGLTALGAGVAGYATAWLGGSLGAIVALGSSLPGAGMLVVGGLALGAIVGGALGGFGAHKLADKLLP